MTNLALIDNKSLWDNKENLDQIKSIFAPKLNNLEFTMFVEMGKATMLNPFLKEIWAVKYDERAAAQIFIGRDGYRKSAQRHPLYDYHNADAVYSNDKFEVSNGEVIHKYNLQDRGVLLGAYCLVKRKGSSRASYTFVEVKEYNKNQSVWKDKPATMIKKVAEAQGLKANFQELFGGTYSEFEQWEKPNSRDSRIVNERGVEGLKSKLGIKEEIDVETGEILMGEIVQDEKEDIETIKWLIDNASNKLELVEIAQKILKLSDSEKDIIRPIYHEKLLKIKG